MTNELATVQNGIQHGAQAGIQTAQNGAALSPAMTVNQAVLQYKLIQKIVSDVLVEGRDYGVIPGTRGGPSLWKPGAEKLCGVFGLAVTIAHVATKQQENFLEYQITVELVSRHTGAVVGQGIGSCNSQEKKYKNVSVADCANTLLKMAKKRAQIDAVLSATGASGFFEDEDEVTPAQRPQNTSQTTQRAPQRGQNAPERNAPKSGPPAPLTEAQEREIKDLAHKAYGPNWPETLREWQGMEVMQYSEARAANVILKLQEKIAADGSAAAPSSAAANDPFADGEAE